MPCEPVEQHVVRRLRDLLEAHQARPETNATRVSGSASEAHARRRGRSRQRAGVLRLVDVRREGAVEVERDEQALGCAADLAQLGRRGSSRHARLARRRRRSRVVEERLRDQAATLVARAPLRRSGRIRLRALAWPACSTACMIASFRPSMSCGLIRTACLSSSAAPANSLSTSTPSLSTRHGDVLLGDEVHAVAERGDEHDVGGQVERDHLLARVAW